MVLLAMHTLKSSKKNFKLKGRPKLNPLIIHYYNIQKALMMLLLIIILKSCIKNYVLANHFYFKKKKILKLILCYCKIRNVAVRFPKHKIVRSILKNINYPLAMPSANISSSVSPVCAKMYLMNLKKKLNLLLMVVNLKLVLSQL